jgi:predicted DsbA family dithiol-disulfide isomerase
LRISVYEDLLCAWSYIADARLQPLRRELGDAVRWRFRPYPLRLDEVALKQRELSEWVGDLERAQREHEGQRLRADLWRNGDPPCSSVPALVALEAAGLQGSWARFSLGRAMRRAALEEGINIARPDVAFELADSVGLRMNRFIAAYQSPQLRRLVFDEHRIAAERGVKGVPTVVVGGRWMISGLRGLGEYRSHILDCIGKLALPTGVSRQSVLH